MAALRLISVVDEGLGNSTYLLDLGDGRALVVDPERDVRPVLAEAGRLALRIAFAAETHLHADFISGVQELAKGQGAEVIAPEVGHRSFAQTTLGDGDGIELGRFCLHALATPGHSPEHLAYLLFDNGELAGVFTGGSLMVGTAGRTDLVSPEMTVPLARAQYRSLQLLMKLPDDTPVWPTHGAGSFCSAGTGTERTTTIGQERRENPLLQVDGEDAFVAALLGSLGTFPDYFLRLGEENRHGPAVIGTSLGLAPLTPAKVRRLIDQGAQVVDVRPPMEFARAHIPDSLSIALRPAFATWLGWLVDPDRTLVIVRSAQQQPDDIVWAAANVGVDRIAGELSGGIAAWTRAFTPAQTTFATAAQIAKRPGESSPIDIRQISEFEAGHVPGARNVELGRIGANAADLPDGPLVVMCGHGERAMTAASILARAGRDDITVLDGSPSQLARASHSTLLTVP